MDKGAILAKAAELVAGDRAKDYGDARTNHQRIADLWSVVLGKRVEPHEVAACMVLLKVARLVETPDHLDSWVDMAGYAGIGGEIATSPAPYSRAGYDQARTSLIRRAGGSPIAASPITVHVQDAEMTDLDVVQAAAQKHTGRTRETVEAGE
ncbi:hypothetical protein SEA_SCHMIDT_71 [Gordonia phage Schmidt]|uniref:DUF6378 domain-containing protein n=1 Tax=Gordonia phage Schmidt TaxID=2301697 RepID=A0A385E0B4_9CAUD|nr:phosphofructokinase [Gordonia phage Schmidt]AXQ65190.1 hypothetical protein SEA_SCHMIDT_71 [Gordonia phage Schmidt]